MNNLLRRPWLWIGLAIVAAVVIVFHPVVFDEYTIANSYAAQRHGPNADYYHGAGLPVRDPAAGACQDEPWLVFIRRSLASGHLPLVNMSNGLGAPVVETLQPGVFYLLNPVLLLLDPATPRFFDAFTLLHVALFVAGLYALLRLYASRAPSLAVAILVGLSGITIQNVNMVHFRCHAWFPLMLYAAVRMARGDRSRWPFFLFVLAHAAQITSGAVQEMFVCSLVVGAVFVIEWWTARPVNFPRWRRLARMALAVTCSVMIGAVSVLPYLYTRATGDILTASSNPLRSIAHASPAEMSNFVFPGAVGFYPHFFIDPLPTDWLPDFSTLGVFLLLAGVVAVLLARAPTAVGRGKYVALLALLLIGVTKLAGLPVFDFLQSIPFLCEILFAKYHLWIFTPCAILIAVGLDALITMDPARRRTSVLFALLLLVIGGGWLVYTTWVSPLRVLLEPIPDPILANLYWTYYASLGLLFVGAALLYFRPPGTLALLVPLAIVHGLLVTPNGWFPRARAYHEPIEHQEMVDPKLAEPEQLGLRPRVFTRYQPNQNLISGFDVVGVFDPVCNAALCRLLGIHFQLQHPQFDLQAVSTPEEPLTQHQLDMLRLLGVTRLYAHYVTPNIQLGVTPGGGHRLEFAMPRVWLLPKTEADNLDKHFGHVKVRQILRYARQAVRPNLPIMDVRETAHGLELRVSQDFKGELVVQQAWAHAWQLDGVSGRPFCRIFPRWSVDLHPGRTYRIEYEPLGFRTGAKISIAGVLLAVASFFLLRRI